MQLSLGFDRSIIDRCIISAFCLFATDLGQCLCGLDLPALQVAWKPVGDLVRIRLHLHVRQGLNGRRVGRFVLGILDCVHRRVVILRILPLRALEVHLGPFLLQVLGKSAWWALLRLSHHILLVLQAWSDNFALFAALLLKNGLDLLSQVFALDHVLLIGQIDHFCVVRARELAWTEHRAFVLFAGRLGLFRLGGGWKETAFNAVLRCVTHVRPLRLMHHLPLVCQKVLVQALRSRPGWQLILSSKVLRILHLYLVMSFHIGCWICRMWQSCCS